MDDVSKESRKTGGLLQYTFYVAAAQRLSGNAQPRMDPTVETLLLRCLQLPLIIYSSCTQLVPSAQVALQCVFKAANYIFSFNILGCEHSAKATDTIR